MVKISEKEIIKDLTNFIAFAQKEENFTYYSEYKFVNELSEKVQDLLDLYKKEKEKTPESVRKQFEVYQNRICELEEKNKQLETENFSLNEMKRYNKKHYIHKDKIKEKLEYQNILWETPNRQKEYSQEVVDVLEELLED